jgi:hypothetical protein
MKNLIFTMFIFLSMFIYGQESDLKAKSFIDEIDSITKIYDSVGNNRQEGISEGVIKYNHIKGHFGWGAYFLNDPANEKLPLRIRYSETQPKENEDLNLYYQNGHLIFAELISTSTKRKSKIKGKSNRRFYFDGNKVIYSDLSDSDIDYVLVKEKTIRKMIYK